MVRVPRRQGQRARDSDGPKGNIGFPAEPEEIAHFVTMLNKVKQSLTTDDIAFLAKSTAAGAEAGAEGEGRRWRRQRA